MPTREGERTWEVIYGMVGSNLPVVEKMSKGAAIWLYHQFVLHAQENPLSPDKMNRKRVETFNKHLSKVEMDELKRLHDLLPPHGY